MARKQPETAPPAKAAKANGGAPARVPQGAPNYPYATTPNALAKFLQNIPNKPKPGKVDIQLLKSWDLRSNDDITLVRVLKEVGVLAADSTPTSLYEDLMNGDVGRKELAIQVKARYKELFNAEHVPYNSDQTATKLFNIHGGTQATRTLQLMRQTFMVLCKSADFTGEAKTAKVEPRGKKREHSQGDPDFELVAKSAGPTVVINIQLTLPTGADEKSYDAFFASMRKHLWPGK